MLEHVPQPAQIVQACKTLVKPGGWVFFSTLNRNVKSYLFAVIACRIHRAGCCRRARTITRASSVRPNWPALPRAAGLHTADIKGIVLSPAQQAFRAVGRHQRQLHVGLPPRRLIPLRHYILMSDPTPLPQRETTTLGRLCQGILFDLDGTLADTAPDLAAAVNKMRHERGLRNGAAQPPAAARVGRRARTCWAARSASAPKTISSHRCARSFSRTTKPICASKRRSSRALTHCSTNSMHAVFAGAS